MCPSVAKFSARRSTNFWNGNAQGKDAETMKVASANNVKVYTVSGEAVRPLPDWLVRKKKRALRDDPGECLLNQTYERFPQ